MATPTYEPIATTTLGSAQATVTFSGISGAYTDLVLVANFTQSVASASARIVFNGDNASGNYSLTEMRGNGTSALSSRTTSQNTGYYGYYADGSTTVPSIFVVNIMNYANTTTYKTAIVQGPEANAYIEVEVGLWRSNSAITSVSLTAGLNNYKVGSTFTLYGIKAE